MSSSPGRQVPARSSALPSQGDEVARPGGVAPAVPREVDDHCVGGAAPRRQPVEGRAEPVARGRDVEDDLDVLVAVAAGRGSQRARKGIDVLEDRPRQLAHGLVVSDPDEQGMSGLESHR